MISLVLATFNRFKELEIFLDSVVDINIEFEIILVDQNDTINLVNLVEKYRILGLKINHIKLEIKNLSLARNIGISHAKYDIVGFPDDDCFYEVETLNNVIREFEKQKADILIGKWVENDFKYEDRVHEISKKKILSFKSCPVSSITIFAKKDVLTNLNGFDIRFGVGQFFGAGEETDLMIRAVQNQYKIIFDPKILVHHKFNRINDFGDQKLQTLISRARGTGAIYFKNNLPIFIILRGVFSPIFKSLFCFSRQLFLYNIVVFYGRVSGMFMFRRNT